MPVLLLLSHSVMLALVSSGCGEIGPLKDSSYTASSAAQQAPFARLNASEPRASPKAWCRDQEDVNGYLQVNLGRSKRAHSLLVGDDIK